MKVAIIPMFGDIKHLQMANVGDIHMALTHLCETHPRYRDYYRTRSAKGEYIILDNSLVELGEAMTFDRVLAAAKRIDAHEVVLPDVFMDKDKTLLAIMRAIADHDIPEHLKLMAVAQGKDWADFYECFDSLLESEHVDVIGIPKATAKYFGSRNQVLAKLLEYGLLYKAQELGKEIHLLGANGPQDYAVGSRYKQIRSIDSVYPIWMAYHGIALHYHYAYTLERPEGKVIHEEMTVAEDDLAYNNIMCTLRWARD